MKAERLKEIRSRCPAECKDCFHGCRMHGEEIGEEFCEYIRELFDYIAEYEKHMVASERGADKRITDLEAALKPFAIIAEHTKDVGDIPAGKTYLWTVSDSAVGMIAAISVAHVRTAEAVLGKVTP